MINPVVSPEGRNRYEGVRMARKDMSPAEVRRQAERQKRAAAKKATRDDAQTHNTAVRERTRR